MAGSVGIGGLIIGVSLLVVFSMAVQTMGYQMQSSMDSLEAAAEPVPNFSVDSSNIWLFALHDVTVAIGDGGLDYVNGTLTASAGGVPCDGFSGSFTVDVNGTIDSVVITSPGDCAASNPTVSFGTPTQTPSATATFTLEMKTYVFANLTNNGQSTIPINQVWMFIDGTDPETLPNTAPLGLPSNNWYSGETLELFWEKSPTTHDRLAFTHKGVTMGTTL